MGLLHSIKCYIKNIFHLNRIANAQNVMQEELRNHIKAYEELRNHIKAYEEREKCISKEIADIVRRLDSDEQTIASLIRSQIMLDELMIDYKRFKLGMTTRTEKLADCMFTANETGEYPEINEDFWDEGEFVMLNKRSYSQAGEDSIIAHIVASVGIPFDECTYLDLGANQPKEMSNTYFYYSKGAKGVLVEANPKLAQRLTAVRSRDVVLNKCISGVSGEYLDFNIMNIDGLSLVGDPSDILEKNPSAKVLETVAVETVSVPDIMEKYFSDKPPVIMNVDIEGMEMDVLNSIDFEKCRPLIIITEMIPYSTGLTVNVKNSEIQDFMKGVGYEEFAFTGINSIFVDMKSDKFTKV